MLARGQFLFDLSLESRLEQADVARPGVCPELLQRGVADAAPGRGDRADEGRIVIRIGDEPQI